MIAIVQIYIHLMKNVEVNIKINNFADIRQLRRAYEIADYNLKQHNLQIYGTR